MRKDKQKEMRFFAQAEYDGLCGFYAALNALRWIDSSTENKKPTEQENQYFFVEAVTCLARVRGVTIQILKNDPNVGGIDRLQIKELCELIVERLELPFKVEDSTNSRRSFLELMRTLKSDKRKFAAIVGTPNGGHWVVVADHRDTSAYHLIDNSAPVRTPFTGLGSRKLSGEDVVILRPLES